MFQHQMADTSQCSVTRVSTMVPTQTYVSTPKKKAVVQVSWRQMATNIPVSTNEANPPKGVSQYEMKTDQITSERIA